MRELEARITELEADNAQLRTENAALKEENARLKRRLGLDSTNSSKPSSADGPAAKPAQRSLHTPSKERSGR